MGTLSKEFFAKNTGNLFLFFLTSLSNQAIFGRDSIDDSFYKNKPVHINFRKSDCCWIDGCISIYYQRYTFGNQ